MRTDKINDEIDLLIYCGNLHVGGGVQVAVNFINEIFNNRRQLQDKRITIVTSSDIYRQLNCQTKKQLAIIKFNSTSFIADKLMLELFSKSKTIFCLFGPLYVLRNVKGKKIVGFARPDIAYKNKVTVSIKASLKRYLSEIFFSLTSDELITETDDVSQQLNKKKLYIGKKIHVVPNVVGTFKDLSAPLSHSLKNREELIFGFVGHNYPHKRLVFLIDALEELALKCKKKITFLTTLNSDVFEEIRHNFDSVEPMNLGILDFEKLPVFYKKVDICVSASVLECFSAFPLESMINSKPVLCSDISSHTSLYKQHAFYFKWNDMSDFVKTALIIINLNQNEIAHHISDAKHFVEMMPNNTDRTRCYLEICDVY